MRLQPVQDPFQRARGAVRLDGFTSWLDCKAGPALAPGSFSVAAWIAPGAYPWRLAPLPDMAPRGAQGFHLSLDSTGRAVFTVALGSKILELRSPGPLALAAWAHVAGVHEAGQGLELYVAGREVAREGHAGAATLGMRPEDLAPAEGLALMRRTVEIVENLSELMMARVDTGGPETLIIQLPGTSAVARGPQVGLTAPPDRLHLLDAERRRLAA